MDFVVRPSNQRMAFPRDYQKMIRMQRAGGDAEEEKKKMEEETRMARMVTVQNIAAFVITCGIIRTTPWLIQQFS